jgi:hypothetical protein
MHKLMKTTAPGWEQTFPTKDAATTTLRGYICPDCMNGGDMGQRMPPRKDNIDDLLMTPCGSGFRYDGPHLTLV